LTARSNSEIGFTGAPKKPLKRVRRFPVPLNSPIELPRQTARISGVPSRKSPDPARLVPLLLSWFATQARDLPWRHTTDPYAIWISEIMLQQTQVKTVIPYWEGWLQELPTVKALAEAPEDRVLKLWEGLGYYSRARNLRAAAQLIMNHHDGRFPTNLPTLLDLPGIGRYTAGAVASIAFNQPAPILDGNVIRVLTRIQALTGDPREKRLNEMLWELAGQLVREAHANQAFSPLYGKSAGASSALNQALMDLGATVCTPRAPTCLTCPVRSLCRAQQLGRQEDFPETAPRPVVTSRYFVVAVLERAGRFLVRKRPSGGVNAGFWEFPNLEVADSALDRRIATARWLSLEPTDLCQMAPVRHSITRYRFHLEVFRATMELRHWPMEVAAQWVTPEELAALALTSAHRRIARQLLGARPPGRTTGRTARAIFH